MKNIDLSVNKEIQIKPTLRFHPIPVTMVVI